MLKVPVVVQTCQPEAKEACGVVVPNILAKKGPLGNPQP